MKKSKDRYEEPIVFTYPNATIRVYHPILDEEEHQRRMKQIEKAAVALILSEMQRKANQNKEDENNK